MRHKVVHGIGNFLIGKVEMNEVPPDFLNGEIAGLEKKDRRRKRFRVIGLF